MTRRRNKPDGLPFRLYRIEGTNRISFFYKNTDGTRAFTYSAPKARQDLIAQARRRAVEEAEQLNGDAPQAGSVSRLIDRYFTWQDDMPRDSERRKAESTLTENKRERKWLDKFFGNMAPATVAVHHIYQYLDGRGKTAPAKANKEIALLSAVFEYGRRLGELRENVCRGIEYNPTRPKTKLVSEADVELAMREARERGGSYLRMALGFQVAYLAVCRPDELRQLHRSAKRPDGLEIPVGKRRRGQAQKSKLVEWTPALKSAVDEALALQVTSSMYLFGNTAGQPYTRSGWSSNWRRLMSYCELRAKKEGRPFTRFALNDMRPTAVTDRMEAGDTNIVDAGGWADTKMPNKVYDRRRERRVKATK